MKAPHGIPSRKAGNIMTAWYLECNEQTTARQAAIMYAADSCRTTEPRDLAMQALIIRGAGDDRDFAIARIRQARRANLAWRTVTQRQWQGKTRRPSRARHHDSISIREGYVAC